MDHSITRSISGRSFSKFSGQDEEDDDFVRTLSTLHREACRIGLEAGSDVFNHRLLSFAELAVWVYRHHCTWRFWNTGALVEVMEDMRGDERITGGVKWWFSGAMLFCVDRALACYQRHNSEKNLIAAEWMCSAIFLGSLLGLNTDDHREKMKALNLARHRPNHDARERVVSEWQKNPATWPSAEKAGLHFSDLLAKEGSTYQPRTVTGWIRAHANLKGIRIR